jgi:hypothetical protein
LVARTQAPNGIAAATTHQRATTSPSTKPARGIKVHTATTSAARARGCSRLNRFQPWLVLPCKGGNRHDVLTQDALDRHGGGRRGRSGCSARRGLLRRGRRRGRLLSRTEMLGAGAVTGLVRPRAARSSGKSLLVPGGIARVSPCTPSCLFDLCCLARSGTMNP